MKNILNFIIRFFIPFILAIPLILFITLTKGVNTSIQIAVWVFIAIMISIIVISIRKRKVSLKAVIGFISVALISIIIYSVYYVYKNEKRRKRWAKIEEFQNIDSKEKLELSLTKKIENLNQDSSIMKNFIVQVDSVDYDSLNLVNGSNSIFVDFDNYNVKQDSYSLEIDGDSIIRIHYKNKDFFEQALYSKSGSYLKYIGFIPKIKSYVFEKYPGELGPNYFCIREDISLKTKGLPLISNKKENYVGFARLYHEIGDIYINIQLWEKSEYEYNEVMDVYIQTRHSGIEDIPFYIRDIQWKGNNFIFIIDDAEMQNSIKVKIKAQN